MKTSKPSCDCYSLNNNFSGTPVEMYVYFETLIQNQTHFCPTLLDFSSGSSQNKVELRSQHRVGEMSFFIYFSD